MKKMLFLIDCQHDFLDGGKLGVDGSTVMIDNLTKYVNEHGKDYDYTIATVDWHPTTHCSFKENGGMWPMHCIQHSQGAAIYEPLLMELNEKSNHFEILTKGVDEDHEEYSIFKNKNSCKRIETLVNTLGIEEIDVVGIALDVCVCDSVKDGLRVLPNVKFNVMKDYCPSIGDGNEFTKFIQNSERIKLV